MGSQEITKSNSSKPSFDLSSIAETVCISTIIQWRLQQSTTYTIAAHSLPT
jgi:hypothetical protein